VRDGKIIGLAYEISTDLGARAKHFKTSPISSGFLEPSFVYEITGDSEAVKLAYEILNDFGERLKNLNAEQASALLNLKAEHAAALNHFKAEEWLNLSPAEWQSLKAAAELLNLDPAILLSLEAERASALLNLKAEQVAELISFKTAELIPFYATEDLVKCKSVALKHLRAEQIDALINLNFMDLKATAELINLSNFLAEWQDLEAAQLEELLNL